MKSSKGGFSILYIVISMVIALILINAITNYYRSSSKNDIELQKIQKEFTIINSWLSNLQKVIFEKASYFTFDTSSLFSFKVINKDTLVEDSYFVDTQTCWNNWKTLFYSNGIDKINLFWNQCIEGLSTVSISFPEPEIKNHLLRVKVSTTYNTYTNTFYVR